MREVVGDTETTGRSHAQGDRIIQLGLIELWNKVPTGAVLTSYFDPEGRRSHREALNVHGIRDRLLIGQPLWRDKAPKIAAFLRQDPFVAHNAAFDVGFINAEMVRAGFEEYQITASRVVDTLALARKKHPGGPNNLAALVTRYKLRSEKFHDALADADMLAQLYVLLKDGPQGGFNFEALPRPDHRPISREPVRRDDCPAGTFRSNAHLIDRERHAAFVATLGGKDTPSIWAEYLGTEDE